jgi:hypothetical protein
MGRDTSSGLNRESQQMSKADDYRKRAVAITTAAKKRTALERLPLLKKQKALVEMADNEDWLDGKPPSQSPPKPVGPK